MGPVIQEERSKKTDCECKDPVNEDANWSSFVVANLWDVKPDNRSWAKLESAHEYHHHNEFKGVIFLVTCIPHYEHADNDGDLINHH